MKTWGPMGIRVVTLLVDGPDEGPPNVNGALTWKNQYKLTDVAVVADPGFSMVEGGSVGTPQMTVVDPRTMRVEFVQQGFSGSFAQLEAVANKNAGM